MARRSNVGALRRRPAYLTPKKRILIVCEGEKTEVLYFGLFLFGLRQASVELKIFGKECGSDPLSVVQFAVSEFNDDGEYDHCYSVIDRDSHDPARFAQAIQLGESTNSRLKGSKTFEVLVSYPCIEFWFILHFEYTRAPFVAGSNKSCGDMARKKLETLLPDYGKANHDSIARLLPLTSDAIKNALRVEHDVGSTGELNPSTTVHRLIANLLSMSEGTELHA